MLALRRINFLLMMGWCICQPFIFWPRWVHVCGFCSCYHVQSQERCISPSWVFVKEYLWDMVNTHCMCKSCFCEWACGFCSCGHAKTKKHCKSWRNPHMELSFLFFPHVCSSLFAISWNCLIPVILSFVFPFSSLVFSPPFPFTCFFSFCT